MKSNPAKTVLTIATGLAVIFFFIQYKNNDNFWNDKVNWLIAISVLIGLIGVFSDSLSIWIEKAWMGLAYVLSLIVPNIILGIVFFLFLLPLSLLSKLFRKEDTLMLRNKSESIYKVKNKDYDKAHFENMW